jgi:hypothetical protein
MSAVHICFGAELAFERRLRFTRHARITDRSQTQNRTEGPGFDSGWCHFLIFLLVFTLILAFSFGVF